MGLGQDRAYVKHAMAAFWQGLNTPNTPIPESKFLSLYEKPDSL